MNISNEHLNAELFIATGCSHCPLVLTELSNLVKAGKLATLKVTNIAVDNVRASELNIRSVPWCHLSNNHSSIILAGNHTAKEIEHWVNTAQQNDGMEKYIETLLAEGELMTVFHAIQLAPQTFSAVINMLGNEETSMDIRIGLDALMENFSTTDILKQHGEALKKLASEDNIRFQIDALHYLALTGDKQNLDFLQERTHDKNPQLKEAAIEALETLNDLI